MIAPRLFTVEALLVLGMLLLASSLKPVLDILRMLPAGRLRKSWIALGVMILSFFVGYGFFSWSLLRADLKVEIVVVVLIMFLGSCFVASVTLLSRQTARDLLHMVTLKQQANVDPLTGLFNRRYLDEKLAEELERAERYGLPLAILLIDVDRFKAVNDTHGHQTGDEVLTRVAQVVSSNVRVNDIAVRYGGEEILVVAPETDRKAAFSLAERLRGSVEALSLRSSTGSTLHVSISVGVAQFRPAEPGPAFVSRADHALYEAKSNGRNRVCDSA
ncbi:MAG: GGDEF domain-containing protein [Janthinobacterium lividum]